MKLTKITFYLFLAAVLLNACRKEYSLEGSGLNVPAGTWQFNDSLKLFSGNMDSAFIDYSSNTNTKELNLIGTSLDGSQTFQLHLFADTFKIGTYKASLFQSSFEYTTTAKTIYTADQLVGEFIVNITSLSSNLIAGTFSGTAIDSGNTIKQLTLGKFSSSISQNGSPGVAVSTGVLGDSLGNCTPVTLAGTYIQGVPLSASNTMQIQVTVATAGSYLISSNTVNGVSFSKTGTFTSTGVQTIILNGSGSPLKARTLDFVLTYGNSTCNFSITFLGDYFPTSSGSNWDYSQVGGTAAGSIHTALINYSPVFGSNTFNTIAAYHVPPGQAYDSLYYYKPGGDYYQYVDYSKYIPFDSSVTGEFIFLKDNVASGTTWSSPNISGTVSGVPVTAFIKMTILAKAVPVTIGIYNFPDVIKVKYEYFITGSAIPVETDERWFAKNAGEIHDNFSNSTSTNTYDISTFIIF